MLYACEPLAKVGLPILKYYRAFSVSEREPGLSLVLGTILVDDFRRVRVVRGGKAAIEGLIRNEDSLDVVDEFVV